MVYQRLQHSNATRSFYPTHGRGIFRPSGPRLLYFTTYHPQVDRLWRIVMTFTRHAVTTTANYGQISITNTRGLKPNTTWSRCQRRAEQVNLSFLANQFSIKASRSKKHRKRLKSLVNTLDLAPKRTCQPTESSPKWNTQVDTGRATGRTQLSIRR